MPAIKYCTEYEDFRDTLRSAIRYTLGPKAVSEAFKCSAHIVINDQNDTVWDIFQERVPCIDDVPEGTFTEEGCEQYVLMMAKCA